MQMRHKTSRNMWETIYSLQDPYLVAKIQKYFGVQVSPRKTGSNLSQKVGVSLTYVMKSSKSNADGNFVGCNGNIPRAKLILENGESSKNKHASIPISGYVHSGMKTCQSSTVPKHRNIQDKNEYEPVLPGSESDKNYIITNYWWHYLFLLGTALGDEIFYASFIPFWFWNIDGAVGRRVVLVWATIMYIGQGIKDIIRWPRPACPPVVRLQKKWALEYGMPSTHAMVGVSIPFSVILYTMNRYQYSVPFGLVIAVTWCTVICISRLYLGMHTVLDIVVGLGLALILMIPVVPLVDMCDNYLLTNQWAPVIMMSVAILLIIFYPASDRWTPTRTDTTMVVSVCVGVHLGAWINYQLGNLTMSKEEPPYHIIWPSYSMLGLAVFRTALGFCCMIATRAFCKSAAYATICMLLRLDPRALKESCHSMENKVKATVEITYTFITYFLLGFNTAFFLPNTFRLLGIERPTFYTEI